MRCGLTATISRMRLPRISLLGLAVLVAVVALACTGSEGEGDQPTEATATASVTATPGPSPVASTPSAAPTATSDPDAWLDEPFYFGPETVPFWIYEELAHRDGCSLAFGKMVPVTLRDDVAKRIETCVPDGTSGERAEFRIDPDGVLYLSHVWLLLIAGESLPQPRESSACNDIIDHLITTDRDPESAAYILVCRYVPPPPGHQHDPAIVVWGRVPEELPEGVTQELEHCYELLRYLGSSQEGRTRSVPCILN